MEANLTDFRAYAAARGYPAPAAASDDDAEAALLRGGDYIRLEYVSRFKSSCDETYVNVVPAIFEAALLELGADGILLPSTFWGRTYTPGERKVLTEVKGIRWQVLEDKTEFGGGFGPVSSIIEALLRACLAQPQPQIGIWAIG